MSTPEQPELLTLDETAALLRISPRTLLNWRSARRPDIPIGFRPAGGRTVLFRRTDVERYIDEQIEAAGGAA